MGDARSFATVAGVLVVAFGVTCGMLSYVQHTAADDFGPPIERVDGPQQGRTVLAADAADRPPLRFAIRCQPVRNASVAGDPLYDCRWTVFTTAASAQNVTATLGQVTNGTVLVTWGDGGRTQYARQYRLRPSASVGDTRLALLRTLSTISLFNGTSLDRAQPVATGNFTLFAPTTPGKYALTARIVTPERESTLFASEGQTLRVYGRNELTERRTQRRLVGFEVLGGVFLFTALAQLALELSQRLSRPEESPAASESASPPSDADDS